MQDIYDPREYIRLWIDLRGRVTKDMAFSFALMSPDTRQQIEHELKQILKEDRSIFGIFS